MNKNLYFKICSITIGCFLCIWSACMTYFLASERKKDESDIPQYTAESAQNIIKSATLSHYIARVQDGKAAIYEVYTNGYEKLILVPDIDIMRLTETDRESFEKGIILKDKSQLASLIEDFTS